MNTHHKSFLLYEDRIARITNQDWDEKKKDYLIHLRFCSYGNTNKGYTYQRVIWKKDLNKRYINEQFRFISTEEVLKILLGKFYPKKSKGRVNTK